MFYEPGDTGTIIVFPLVKMSKSRTNEFNEVTLILGELIVFQGVGIVLIQKS